MRIRTIKPEFWGHRMHEVVSETAAMTAIGLLNYADDEGRFLANPRAIECTLFPVRSPRKSMVKCLDELEAAGFIMRYEAQVDGRTVKLGVIINFRRHQVISKPQPSRLPAPGSVHDGSGSAPASLQDRSSTVPGSFQDRSRNDPGRFHADSTHGREGKGILEAGVVLKTAATPTAPGTVMESDMLPDQDLPLAEPMPPPRQTWPDWRIMHGRIHVGADEGRAWEALFREYGPEPLDHAYRELAPGLPPGRRLHLSAVTAWLSERYEAVP